MTFEYILDFECPVKKQIDLKDISAFAMKRNQLNNIEAEIKKEKGEVKDSDIYTAVTITADGRKKTDIKVGDLRAEVEALLKYAQHCYGCNANVQERTYGDNTTLGCHGTVRYPVSRTVEVILMEAIKYIIEHKLQDREGLIIQYILEHDKIGKRSKRMRKVEGVYFERQSPLSHEFTYQNVKRKITTDEIVEALFGYNYSPAYAEKMFVPFFHIMEGVVNFVGRSDASMIADPCLIDLRAYGNALRIISEIECEILNDM